MLLMFADIYAPPPLRHGPLISPQPALLQYIAAYISAGGASHFEATSTETVD